MLGVCVCVCVLVCVCVCVCVRMCESVCKQLPLNVAIKCIRRKKEKKSLTLFFLNKNNHTKKHVGL